MEAAIGRPETTGTGKQIRSTDSSRLSALLQSLIRQSLNDGPQNDYLTNHSRFNNTADHVGVFGQYIPFLPTSGRLLDWGCYHAPDSCLLKTAFPNRFQISGCDFAESRHLARFHEYAGLEYRQLTDIVATPYDSGEFDAVIGSGVLEHVAMDYESLKELHRILKPGGVLIITYLPNWLSWREWVHRVIRKRDFHQRRYGLAEAQTLLKRAGFLPELAEHANYAHPALGPLKFLCSTLTLVARKVHAM